MPATPWRRAGGYAVLVIAVLAQAALVVGAGAVRRARADTAGTPLGGPLLGVHGVVTSTGENLPPLPPTTATSFIVADADTGEVLAAKDAHRQLAPASTLKVLTAITLIPRLDPAAGVVVQPDAVRVDGTKVGVVAGQTYSVRDLLTAMLMMSANDAAVALADANGGLGQTLAEMNAEAAWLNARDTVAKTPDGLDAPNQASSAYDLALMFRAGLAIPAFRTYLSITRMQFPAPKGASYQIQTHDRLLLTYPGMIGGKNGYTVAAQASYVGAAARNGHTIIVAVMRDQPNFWNEVKGLFDWGFAVDGTATPIGTLVPPGPLTSPSAEEPAPSLPAGTSHIAAAARPSTPARHRGAGDLAMGLAVAVGGSIFMGAMARAAAIRRRQLRRGRTRTRGRVVTDSRYLEGLSRLARADETPGRR